MKNIIGEKPTVSLHGRLKESTRFVDDADILGKRILDIGCGYGWFELHALACGASSVIGTEIGAEDLSTAKAAVTDPRAEFIVSSALDISLPDASVDTVVSWEVIEHIPKGTEPKMLSEIFRVLRPGGSVYLSTPHASVLSNAFDPAWWLIGHRHYSRRRLTALFRDAGLEPQAVMVKGGMWELLGNLNMYFSKWILRRPPVFDGFFQANIDAEYRKDGIVGMFIKAGKGKGERRDQADAA